MNTPASSQPYQGDFAAILGKYGLSPEDVEGQTLDASNGDIVLDTDGGPSAIEPRILTTSDLDDMRRWLGAPEGSSKGMVRSISTPFHFSAEKVAAGDDAVQLTNAGFDYVFHGGGFAAAGDQASSLKASVEKAFGEMRVAVFAVSSIVVGPGNNLIVTGSTPVALVYSQMTIQAGGQVQIFAPGTMTIGTLTKTS